MFEEDDRVRIADCGLEQRFGVCCIIGRHDLEAGNGAVPGCIILAVLGTHAACRAVGPTEHDGAAHLAAGHVERLGS